MNLYLIGGSPCSGKSTVAQILAERHGLYYFKVDDHLEKYIQLCADKGYPMCQKQNEMNSDQIWMRDPSVQCEEELALYEEIFGFIWEELNQIACGRDVITEGAAYLPNLMKHARVADNRYVSLTPTEAFQIFHYSKREWVPYVLAQCSDPEVAFRNWMERDVLFAKEIRRRCGSTNYLSLLNNGEYTIEELTEKVSAHFGLA